MLLRLYPILFLVIIQNILLGNSLLQESSNDESNIPEDGIPQNDNSKVNNNVKVSSHPGWRAIDIYNMPNYKGSKFRATINSKCGNVPVKLRGNVGSIDTLGSCVVIYASLNCAGNSATLERHSWSSIDVKTTLGFATGIWTGPQSLRLAGSKDSSSVTFYSQPNYEGRSSKVNLPLAGDCVDLPSRLNNAAQSIRFGSDSLCIVVYTETHCTGHPSRFLPGTRGVRDLGGSGIAGMISSVQLCSAPDSGRMVYLSMMTGTNSKVANEGTSIPEMEWEQGESGRDTKTSSEKSPVDATKKPQVRRKRSMKK